MGLAPGTTDNTQACPKCGGGSDGSRSFSVSRIANGTVLFMCHRAKCGFTGSIRAPGDHGAGVAKPFVPRVYTGELEKLPKSVLALLKDKYELMPDILEMGQVSYAPAEHALAFPMRSPILDHRGWVLRYLDPDARGRKRVMTYRELDEPFLGWYHSVMPHILVVEDALSAIKGAMFATTVCLNGTNINDQIMYELAGERMPIVLALDKDATDKAVHYKKKYELWGNLSVLPLSKDIKDTPYQELREIMYHALV